MKPMDSPVQPLPLPLSPSGWASPQRNRGAGPQVTSLCPGLINYHLICPHLLCAICWLWSILQSAPRSLLKKKKAQQSLCWKPFSGFPLLLEQTYMNMIMGPAQPVPFPLHPHLTPPCSPLLYWVRIPSPSFRLCPFATPPPAIAHTTPSAWRTHPKRVYYNHALFFSFLR